MTPTQQLPAPTLVLVALCVCATALAASSSAADPQPAGLMVNGRLSDLPEPALLDGDRLLVSGSVLATELGVGLESTSAGAWRLRTYGQEIVVRPGSPRYTANGSERTATVAPLYRGDDLFVPVEMIAGALKITVTQGATWHLRTPAASVLGIRQGTHPDRVRLVVDLSAPVQFRYTADPGKVVIEFPAGADGEGRQQMLRLHAFDDALAPQVSEILEAGLVRVVIGHQSGKPPVVMTLDDPPRIVVDLFREVIPSVTPPCPPPEAPPAPSGLWRTQLFTGARGPVRGYVVQVNLQDDSYALKPALAGETIMRRSTVSRIARQYGACAAINGGFFSALGPPLGLLVVDGEWIKAPLYGRAVFGVDREGRCAIRRVDFAGRVDFEGVGSLPLEGINQGHTDPDGVVAYTPRWGSVVIGAQKLTRLVVGTDGAVAQVLRNGEAAMIPAGGFVLSGHGRRAETLATIGVGTKARLSLETLPPWPGLHQALGGGPLLVQAGRVNVTAAEERFRPDVASGSRPRSALGLTDKGDLILLAVENPGLTLRELAGIMTKLGARDSMNLDGGGSTALVVQGRLLNRPSDGCERAVSNALLVLDKRAGQGGL